MIDGCDNRRTEAYLVRKLNSRKHFTRNYQNHMNQKKSNCDAKAKIGLIQDVLKKVQPGVNVTIRTFQKKLKALLSTMIPHKVFKNVFDPLVNGDI